MNALKLYLKEKILLERILLENLDFENGLNQKSKNIYDFLVKRVKENDKFISLDDTGRGITKETISKILFKTPDFVNSVYENFSSLFARKDKFFTSGPNVLNEKRDELDSFITNYIENLASSEYVKRTGKDSFTFGELKEIMSGESKLKIADIAGKFLVSSGIQSASEAISAISDYGVDALETADILSDEKSDENDSRVLSMLKTFSKGLKTVKDTISSSPRAGAEWFLGMTNNEAIKDGGTLGLPNEIREFIGEETYNYFFNWIVKQINSEDNNKEVPLHYFIEKFIEWSNSDEKYSGINFNYDISDS